ncbi:MAG: hypothetical protein KA715_04470 [Xanthomonadaceae bacterium]|nr:hypothetical protein [Xanthomonadaceae bacterium]
MNILQKIRKRYLKNELGQSTVEYILILAAVVMVASKFRGPLQNLVNTVMGKTTANIEKDLGSE